MKIDCFIFGLYSVCVLKVEKMGKGLELFKVLNYYNNNKIRLINNFDVSDISSG